jgi:hypothetical protein
MLAHKRTKEVLVALVTVAVFSGLNGAAGAQQNSDQQDTPLQRPAAVPATMKSPSRSPLRLIGHVHAKTAFCMAVVDHGGMATAAALQGDENLDDDIHWLSTAQLDSSELAKEHGVLEMSKRYAELGERARAAIDEAKALRTVAETAPTPEQKTALIAYADAIGGALHRQTLLADALSRVMMNVQQQPRVTSEQRDEDLLAAAFRPPGPFQHSWDPRDRVPESLTEMVHAAAIELTNRRTSETNDEIRAAQNTQAAFSPCQI